MYTPHRTHTTFHASCAVCRWERMSDEERADYRAVRSSVARATWRRRHPERAARRDAILAGRVPEPCAGCGTSAEVRPFVTDYEAGTVRWLCTPCAKAGRESARAA